MIESRTSPEIVTAGGTRMDYLISRDGRAMNGVIGGNALYSAVGAALWSDSVGAWSRIGQNYPRKWFENLREAGIDTNGIVTIQGNFAGFYVRDAILD